ncbi:MAG TPA: glycosyltransferase family 4 protein [Patescibacteria group bacterium]|nr:glycosyltransferase family 4 protein [Patescibacteria group bacterium]
MLKILQVNKFFYHRGGTESFFFDLSKLLRQHGNEVVFFSQHNPRNQSDQDEKYFIPNIELGKFNWPALINLGRMFWSFTAQKKIKQLIKTEQPDIAHIHNIYHQISPSILPILKSAGIPIVMTVHDFKLIKPDYTLRADNKKVIHKNSIVADTILKLEFYWHKLLKIYQKNVDLFIAPSEFVKNKLIAGGFDNKKIQVVPHFIDTSNYPNASAKIGNYILYFGRLDESKGIDTLIKALADTDDKSIMLKIVGSGPMENDLKSLIRDLDLNSRIELLGQKDKAQLIEIISDCMFTVVPSRVHETFGLSALESMACGKPVIATSAGALDELVKDRQTGLIVNVNDASGLTEKINYLISNQTEIINLGKNARKLAEEYSPQRHIDAITKIYQYCHSAPREGLNPAPNL